jgi:regulator of protease activity HflC (stomatin/prohibitin superfamily)
LIPKRYHFLREEIEMLRETETRATNGLTALFILIFCLLGAIGGIIASAMAEAPLPAVGCILGVVAILIGLGGLFMVEPNQGKVLMLFGDYKGTVRTPGLRWANPFFSKRSVSLRVRNFETQRLKVNDHDGNPIEIAAVVVWRVVDTAEAVFQVDSYENFVQVQSEAAVRNLSTRYSYDAHGEGEMSLRGNTAEVADELRKEIQARLEQAGVRVEEARISHLAYAQEIAQAMLQRQQASAIIAARQKIVDGAVGMVEMALERLSAKNVVKLDEERKAAMVSNLLVVLCGERAVSPVVNTGTLYS